jgi:hypothetical protein
MSQRDRIPWRFGTHASLIQLLAMFAADTGLDGHVTEGACALASLLFWTCAALLLLRWRAGRPSRVALFFLRWGLLAFVVIGTPLLRPVVGLWWWLLPLLSPGLALLLVMPPLYLVPRAFGLPSPFDDTPPATEA